jgi:hypothetical protein
MTARKPAGKSRVLARTAAIFLPDPFNAGIPPIRRRCVQIAMVTSGILQAIASSAKLSVRSLTLPFVAHHEILLLRKIRRGRGIADMAGPAVGSTQSRL